MDKLQTQLKQQVANVVDNPNVPDYVKVQMQNFAGYMYYSQGILNMTMTNNTNYTLSPLAAMNPVVTLDFKE